MNRRESRHGPAQRTRVGVQDVQTGVRRSGVEGLRRTWLKRWGQAEGSDISARAASSGVNGVHHHYIRLCGDLAGELNPAHSESPRVC